jgi:hypothetical protein
MKPTSRLRKTANLSESILQQLNMYALVAGAAGVGVLTLGQLSEAKIIYTAAHEVIGPKHQYNLDLNHDKSPTSAFKTPTRVARTGVVTTFQPFRPPGTEWQGQRDSDSPMPPPSERGR